MSYFKDTTGWVRAEKWIIEKPERQKTSNEPYRLYGQENKFHITLSELRCVAEAKWTVNYNQDGSVNKDDPELAPGHKPGFVIVGKGSIDDRIYLFKLNDKDGARRFSRISQVAIRPMDAELRKKSRSPEDQKMVGVIFYDETLDELSLDVSVDRDAFMSVFETVTRSPMVARGSLYVSANVFIDEVERFFMEPGDIRHYGLLQEGNVYSASAPVGVESFSVSLFSSAPPSPPANIEDEDEPPALRKNRFFG